MTKLLMALFVKETDTPDGRAKVGSLAGTVGIICNLLLFLGKVIAGTLAGSVAIAADGWNNLSDAARKIHSPHRGVPPSKPQKGRMVRVGISSLM